MKQMYVFKSNNPNITEPVTVEAVLEEQARQRAMGKLYPKCAPWPNYNQYGHGLRLMEVEK